jgi:hypothetical protein
MLKKLFQLWSIEGPWKNQSVPSTDIDITGAPPAIQHWTVIRGNGLDLQSGLCRAGKAPQPLSFDCLRRVSSDDWAIHVPLGKLKTERMVPVDAFVCRLVDRLRVLRSQDSLPADGFLLARPSGRNVLIRRLRTVWRNIVATAGITTRIVPHQLRHSFGTEMLRAGVTLPAVVKLLGHLNPEMTMRYLEVSTLDLQREFHLAQSEPRHLLPPSRFPASTSSPQADLACLLKTLLVARHVLEMFRRTLSQGPDRRVLDHLNNRLAKIISEIRKLAKG